MLVAESEKKEKSFSIKELFLNLGSRNELYSLEVDFCMKISSLGEILRNPLFRNALLLMYHYGVNYQNSIVRGSNMCRWSGGRFIIECQELNLIRKITTIPEKDERVLALFNFLHEQRNHILLNQKYEIYELTPWFREFMTRNLNFFHDSIDEKIYTKIKHYAESVQRFRDEIKNQKQETQKEELKIGEYNWFKKFNNPEKLGEPFFISAQRQHFNNSLGLKLTIKEFNKKLDIYRTMKQ